MILLKENAELRYREPVNRISWVYIWDKHFIRIILKVASEYFVPVDIPQDNPTEICPLPAISRLPQHTANIALCNVASYTLSAVATAFN